MQQPIVIMCVFSKDNYSNPFPVKLWIHSILLYHGKSKAEALVILLALKLLHFILLGLLSQLLLKTQASTEKSTTLEVIENEFTLTTKATVVDPILNLTGRFTLSHNCKEPQGRQDSRSTTCTHHVHQMYFYVWLDVMPAEIESSKV